LHHFIAFCTTLVGESATMASEAAVLGVPAFYIADTGRGYTDEQQRRYGLVENFTLEHAGDALERLQELLATPDLRALGHEKRERLLSERIDTTAWMMSYIDSVVKQSR
jgi:hypothetical protein